MESIIENYFGIQHFTIIWPIENLLYWNINFKKILDFENWFMLNVHQSTNGVGTQTKIHYKKWLLAHVSDGLQHNGNFMKGDYYALSWGIWYFQQFVHCVNIFPER